MSNTKLPEKDTPLEHAIAWVKWANSSRNMIQSTAKLIGGEGFLLVDNGQHKIVVGQVCIEVQRADGARVFPPPPEWKSVPPTVSTAEPVRGAAKTHILSDDDD